MKLLMLTLLLFLAGTAISQTNFELENTSNSIHKEQIDLSSNSFYNSGIEYYYKNEFGKAIWAFESALKIDPANEDAAINLEIINKERTDYITSESKGVSNWFARNIYSFSPNFWFYTSLISGLVAVLLLYLFFIPSSKTINNISLFGSTLFGFVLIASFSFSLLHKSKLTTNTKAVIINTQTNLLTDPILNSAVSYHFSEGSQLNIISIQDDWYELQVNNTKGWVLKDSVWVY